MLMMLTGQAEDMIRNLVPGSEKNSLIWIMTFVMISSLPLLTGFILDMAIGDPRKLPHPIRLIGWSIVFIEKLLRRGIRNSSKNLLRRGAVLAVSTTLLTAAATSALLWLAWSTHFAIGLIVETVLCWLILAARSLKTETSPVQQSLERGDLISARERLSWLVGRDTANLNSEDIAKAAVETIAENTNDGITAPLFYMALGGPVLGMVYKTINTLDSMVGYRNERYLYFGRSSARLDDWAGFLPARVSALLMILAAALLRLSARRAWQIFRRDRHNHLSPNSAQTESVCAGALGIRLGGNHYYGGQLVEKPTIGNETRTIEPEDIGRTQQLMIVTSILSLLLFWPMNILLQLIVARSMSII